MYIWFVQQREKGVLISGEFLKTKAVKFCEELEGSIGCDPEQEFKASDGWLTRWKKRYEIRRMNICGEKLNAQPQLEELNKFKRKPHKILTKDGYTGEQIYNCDESGLYYRSLPTKTLVAKEERSAPGYKISKDRVTLMACSHVTGDHKLKLLIIGKSKNPRAFKKIKQRDSLPVYYIHQKSALDELCNFQNLVL